MSNVNLWYAFAGLFAVAGALHFVRALSRTGGKRSAGFALAGASVIWGVTAIIFRFVGIGPAILVGLGAVGLMLIAAVTSGRVR